MNRLGSERYLFVQFTPVIRARLEASIENLIAMLDALDGDPDVETSLPEFDPERPPRFGARARVASFLDDDERDGDDERAAQPLTLNCGAFP